MIYPVDGGRPRDLLLRPPADDIYTPRESWMERCGLQRWFPDGLVAERISVIPGTDFELTNHYTVLSTQAPTQAPDNACVRSAVGVTASGNIIVLRHAAANPFRVTSIRSAERRFIDLVIRRCVLSHLLEAQLTCRQALLRCWPDERVMRNT